jgi:WD40 repeat protein
MSRWANGPVDNIVRIWDADTGLEIGLLKGRTGSVLSVDFSADGGRNFSNSDFVDVFDNLDLPACSAQPCWTMPT